MHPPTVPAFRQAVEAGDSDAVLATFAADITFHNPVTFRPFEGIDSLALVVPRLLDVWENLRYVGELHGDGLVGLIFDARVGSCEVRGIDLLRFDEDVFIDEITVMARPLTGLQALATAMEAALSSGSR